MVMLFIVVVVVVVVDVVVGVAVEVSRVDLTDLPPRGDHYIDQ